MPTYTPEQKQQRKNTIRAWNFMQMRDRVLGIRPTPPPQVIHHPRFSDPSPWCRAGVHKWFTKTLMGIPILKCRKCGRIVMKGSFEGTETKREIRTRHVSEPEPLPPRFEVVE